MTAAEKRALELRAKFNAEAKERMDAKMKAKAEAAAAARVEADAKAAWAKEDLKAKSASYGFSNPVHVRRRLAELRAAGVGRVVELRLNASLCFNAGIRRLTYKLKAEGYDVEIKREFAPGARAVCVVCLDKVVGTSSYESVQSDVEVARLITAATAAHTAAHNAAQHALPPPTPSLSTPAAASRGGIHSEPVVESLKPRALAFS